MWLVVCKPNCSQMNEYIVDIFSKKNEHLLFNVYQTQCFPLALWMWCYYYPLLRDTETNAWKG